MKCIMCGREQGAEDEGLVLSGWGWLCSIPCYRRHFKKREVERAQEVWGKEATV